MLPIDAPIVAVTVYTNRARVTRRGAATLAAGEHTLSISGLPNTVDAESVRAGGRGDALRVLGAEVASEFIAKPTDTTIAELQRQLADLQDEDRAQIDSDQVENQHIEFLHTLSSSGGQDLARGLSLGRAGIDTIEALGSYIVREMAAAQARQREIVRRRHDLAREIAVLQARLERLEHGQEIERREIRVAVEAEADTRIELEVSYMVAGASWEPDYDIHLDDTDVSMTYLAQIQQQSGEDWPAVALTLSTARPATSATLPELAPWYIDVPHPPVIMPTASMGGGRMRSMAPPPAMEILSEDSDFARADRQEFAGMPMLKAATAQIETSGAAVSYHVARPIAIPSDGSPHRTTVTTLDLSARLDYVTAPKLAEEAYLRAKIKNTSPFLLLPGGANIFHGNDFVGRTRIETIAPDEEFEAQLGVDTRVKVERKLTTRTVDKSLIGNTRRTLFGYTLTLTNLLATPAHITVLDQLPVPRNEAIKVKLQEASLKPSEQSDLQILKWELDLKPQEKREISFAFQVEHARGITVIGLA